MNRLFYYLFYPRFSLLDSTLTATGAISIIHGNFILAGIILILGSLISVLLTKFLIDRKEDGEKCQN